MEHTVYSISLLSAELFFTAVWIVIRVIVWIRNRKIDWKREALLLLMYVNLAVIIRIVFFPMERSYGKVQPLLFDPGAILPFKIILSPFVRMFDFETKTGALINVTGNVAMFIPSGIILPILYRKLDRFRKVVAAGALISLCIEILQLPLSTRTSDINDLILNTAGTAIGYGIYALAKSVIRRKASAPSDQHGGDMNDSCN